MMLIHQRIYGFLFWPDYIRPIFFYESILIAMTIPVLYINNDVFIPFSNELDNSFICHIVSIRKRTQ
ncbi:hypothetical protein CF128_07460 [Aeromonas veronii]|nr:hypothetical protein CF128_07460 [Aeromonas veronii]